jgi:hypothetical protein
VIERFFDIINKFFKILAIIPKIDEATKGGLSQALMAGAKNVRSNYALIRAAGDDDAAKGMLASLNLIVGGLTGAVAGGRRR